MKQAVALALVLSLSACGGGEGGAPKSSQVVAPTPTPTPEPTPPVVFKQAEQELFYDPDTEYSYYSPGVGTIGARYTEHVDPVLYGEPFPSGFLVQEQFARTVTRYNADGSVAWSRGEWGGRFATINGDKIFVTGSSLNVVDILSLDGEHLSSLVFERPVNYARVFGDKLVAVYRDYGPADVFGWNGTAQPLEFATTKINYARAAAIEGDRIALADTFGRRVVIQNMKTGEVEKEIPASYPNDVQWVGDYLYFAEEHMDRITAYHVPTGKRTVVMAPPNQSLWNAEAQDQEGQGCGPLSPPRSKSSDECSGAFTLYSPNGIYVTERGMFVADTDNSRVIYVEDGKVRSALVGLNNAVKVMPF